MSISPEVRIKINAAWKAKAEEAIRVGRVLSTDEEADVIIDAYEAAKPDPRMLIDKMIEELIDGLDEEIRKEPYPLGISSMSAVEVWNYLMDTIIPRKATVFKATLGLASKTECECDEISNGETCIKCGPSPETSPSTEQPVELPVKTSVMYDFNGQSHEVITVEQFESILTAYTEDSLALETDLSRRIAKRLSEEMGAAEAVRITNIVFHLLFPFQRPTLRPPEREIVDPYVVKAETVFLAGVNVKDLPALVEDYQRLITAEREYSTLSDDDRSEAIALLLNGYQGRFKDRELLAHSIRMETALRSLLQCFDIQRRGRDNAKEGDSK